MQFVIQSIIKIEEVAVPNLIVWLDVSKCQMNLIVWPQDREAIARCRVMSIALSPNCTIQLGIFLA